MLPLIRGRALLSAVFSAGLILGLPSALPCAAQTLASPDLADLTSPEVQAAIAAGTTTIIIPIGGTEQSGPYIVLGKHNVRVKVLSDMIARQLGATLVAPIIAYVPEGDISPPTGHMRFAGTISISAEAFRSTLTAAARSLAQAGFRDVVFLGDHGGYQTEIGRVVKGLNEAWFKHPGGPRAYTIPAYYGTVATIFQQTLRDHHLTLAEIGTHAGVSDTSLQLAVDPGGVRIAQVPTSPPPLRQQGVEGDPRRSSAALGQLGVAEIVTATVAAIKQAVASR